LLRLKIVQPCAKAGKCNLIENKYCERKVKRFF